MNTEKEYWIFADESVQDGEHFSRFFGGCIVPASTHAEIEERLSRRKDELGFGKELKWQRVTNQRLPDYVSMITSFFDEIREDRVRMRVMFQDNQDLRRRSTGELRHEPYYKLYYQFLKNDCEGQALPTHIVTNPHTQAPLPPKDFNCLYTIPGRQMVNALPSLAFQT